MARNLPKRKTILNTGVVKERNDTTSKEVISEKERLNNGTMTEIKSRINLMMMWMR